MSQSFADRFLPHNFFRAADVIHAYDQLVANGLEPTPEEAQYFEYLRCYPADFQLVWPDDFETIEEYFGLTTKAMQQSKRIVPIVSQAAYYDEAASYEYHLVDPNNIEAYLETHDYSYYPLKYQKLWHEDAMAFAKHLDDETHKRMIDPLFKQALAASKRIVPVSIGQNQCEFHLIDIGTESEFLQSVGASNIPQWFRIGTNQQLAAYQTRFNDNQPAYCILLPPEDTEDVTRHLAEALKTGKRIVPVLPKEADELTSTIRYVLIGKGLTRLYFIRHKALKPVAWLKARRQYAYTHQAMFELVFELGSKALQTQLKQAFATAVKNNKRIILVKPRATFDSTQWELRQITPVTKAAWEKANPNWEVLGAPDFRDNG